MNHPNNLTPIPDRVTPGEVQASIKKTDYVYHERLTICILTLKNGFKVTGESACVSDAQYNQAKGEQYAFEKAFDQAWSLEGYALCDRLYRSTIEKAK